MRELQEFTKIYQKELNSLVLHKYCRNFQSDYPPCLEPKR